MKRGGGLASLLYWLHAPSLSLFGGLHQPRFSCVSGKIVGGRWFWSGPDLTASAQPSRSNSWDPSRPLPCSQPPRSCNKYIIKIFFYVNRYLGTGTQFISVGDLDSYWTLGYGSVIICTNPYLDTDPDPSANSQKNLDFSCFLTSLWLIFVGVLKATYEKSRIRIRKLVVRIRRSGAVAKCHRSTTLLVMSEGSVADRNPRINLKPDLSCTGFSP